MRKIIFTFTMIAFCLTFCILCAEEQAKKENNPQVKKENNPVVLMKTSMGEIKIELYPEKAPITVKNFLSYVDKGFYDGTIFHRVISTFMIQGGGLTPDMVEKKGDAPIKNEAGNGLKNEKYTLAMARTPVVDSATSQFFINVVDNVSLDHKDETGGYGYCVFGKVIGGMDVVDKIKMVKTGNKGPHQNVPVEIVKIESVKRAGENKSEGKTEKKPESKPVDTKKTK
jgi:cyclophilin family peptidyl-prolyl cis-trans isomerase